MGKKNADVMQAQRQKFLDGAKHAEGQPRRRPRHLFDLMEHFAGYGFNKSHSTAYALRGLPDGVPQGELPVRTSWRRC